MYNQKATTITVDLEIARAFAVKAIEHIKAIRKEKKEKVLKEHAADKAAYDKLFFIYKFFKTDPLDHPEKGDFFSDWANEWYRATDFNQSVFKLCEDVIRADTQQARITVELDLYNIMVGWAA